ncbi:hypothetical protein CRV15_28725 (plasmid) [Streptomyces clavuligerus]|nr:hypothetical protein CRV15_28725 [Streptomyces clavuligerus]
MLRFDRSRPVAYSNGRVSTDDVTPAWVLPTPNRQASGRRHRPHAAGTPGGRRSSVGRGVGRRRLY